jgi:AraC family transcriptional regulator
MSGICEEVTERCVANVQLHDILKSHDPIVTAAAAAITREAQHHALGSALYVEAVATQLTVHLLRKYASVTFREPSGKGKLSPAQVRRLTAYIDDKLHEQLNLQALAAVVGLGIWTFTRHFRESFGRTRTLTSSSGASIGRDACWRRAPCQSRKSHRVAGLPIRPT